MSRVMRVRDSRAAAAQGGFVSDCRAAIPTRHPSCDALDDAQITIGTVPERAKRLLICGTVVRGNGLRDALELEKHDALREPAFINACREAARQEAAAGRFQCRARQPGVSRQRLLVPY